MFDGENTLVSSSQVYTAAVRGGRSNAVDFGGSPPGTVCQTNTAMVAAIFLSKFSVLHYCQYCRLRPDAFTCP